VTCSSQGKPAVREPSLDRSHTGTEKQVRVVYWTIHRGDPAGLLSSSASGFWARARRNRVSQIARVIVKARTPRRSFKNPFTVDLISGAASMEWTSHFHGQTWDPDLAQS